LYLAETPYCRIALIQWAEETGIREAIRAELVELGHELVDFSFDGVLPANCDVLFLYGPFGKYLQVLQQLEAQPKRPIVVFWNTEGLPDPKIPWFIQNLSGMVRSWIGRMNYSPHSYLRPFATTTPFSLIDDRLTRVRYLGDFFYAQRKGWLDVFFDISAVYAQFFNRHGLPAKTAPFGTFDDWYSHLQVERDIDVIWMGKRGTDRRGQILDQLRQQLRGHGVEIYMADGEENPFIYDEARNEILNRSKITLNILRTWYDENSLRFCMAMPNRSLCVSEPLLPHVPAYEAGKHYVAAPVAQMTQTILHYLCHDEEREQITQNAYELMVNQLTMRQSMQMIMQEVAKRRT
jgi:hypothetical protein